MTTHPLVQQLREHVATLPGDPISDPGSGLCTTIQGDGERFWLQLCDEQINFLHLDDEAKEQVLDALLEAVGEPVAIEKGLYVTFNLPPMDVAAMNALLTRLLREYYGVPEEETAEIFTEEM